MAIMRQVWAAVIKIALIATAATATSSLSAATLDFDCDAMPDHTSSVTQVAIGPEVSVSGNLSIVEKRKGHFLPLAGILISPAESQSNSDFVGFQIAATRDGKATSNITLRDHKDRDSIISAATIADGEVKRFRFSLGAAGKASLAINERAYTIDVPRTAAWSNLRIKAVCSQGQFKFSDLRISNGPAKSDH